ncbi:hypothetical protein RHGRI_031329 [Rhododendron griersonianum]|uniref:Uncharacterized protein n=1 Tax=Rhododendron griersonianum TaxID=479676 RepID=A0AAV6I9Y1_9ERIC|nr:hypothetical protein RHGRI_031329 [Rhododendron griersonianum]
MFQVFCRLSGNSNFRLIQYRVLVESSSVCLLVREACLWLKPASLGKIMESSGKMFEQLFMVFGKARPAEPVDYNKRCPLCKIPVLLLKLNGKRESTPIKTYVLSFLLTCHPHLKMWTLQAKKFCPQLIVSVWFLMYRDPTLFDSHRSFPCVKFIQLRQMLVDSLQLDHDACGNLDSMILPCCGELREPKGGHYHNIVEIMKNAGKCLLSEYAAGVTTVCVHFSFHFRPAECTKIWSFVSSCSAAVLGMSLSFVSNKSFAYLILRKWSSKWLIVLETCWTDILMFSVYNQEVYFYAINTNAQALLQSAAKKPLQIGELFTRGLALWWESTLGRTSCGGIKGTDCWRCIEFNFSGLPPLSYVMVW